MREIRRKLEIVELKEQIAVLEMNRRVRNRYRERQSQKKKRYSPGHREHEVSYWLWFPLWVSFSNCWPC